MSWPLSRSKVQTLIILTLRISPARARHFPSESWGLLLVSRAALWRKRNNLVKPSHEHVPLIRACLTLGVSAGGCFPLGSGQTARARAAFRPANRSTHPCPGRPKGRSPSAVRKSAGAFSNQLTRTPLFTCSSGAARGSITSDVSLAESPPT